MRHPQLFRTGIGALMILGLQADSVIAASLSVGDVLVAEHAAGIVRQYSASGVDLGIFVGGLNGAGAISADRGGNIYVAETWASRVHKLSSSGASLLTIATDYAPTDVRVGPDGLLYVADYFGARVYRYDPISGKNLGLFASLSGLARADFLAFDSIGNLYVTDFHDPGIVRRISPAGVDLGNFITFPGVEGIAFDDSGNLYAASWTSGTIGKFSPSGTDLGTFAAGLHDPYGIAFDGDGNLYVAGGGSVRKFSPDGVDLGIFAAGLSLPRALAVIVSLPPDLVVSALSDPPGVAVIKGKFSVTDTTANTGTTTAGATRTRYYLSADTERDPGDKRLGGARSVPWLAPDASSTGTRKVTIPASTKLGVYFLLACADDDEAIVEGDETNNCRASATQVEVLAPNLKETALTNPPESVPRGGSFEVTDTVENLGNAAAGPSTTRYYLSVDAKKSGADWLLTGTRAVNGLAPGSTDSGSVSVSVPIGFPTGTFFLLACADNLKKVSESSEKDNCRASASRVTIGP